MSVGDFNTDLIDYIASSPTPFHAASMISAQLADAGYQVLDESHEWKPAPGNYYVRRNESSIIAFTLPDNDYLQQGFRMVGAHTDSPCLKLKPSPGASNCGYYQLGVEVYGGALLNPWFDRDLSIAGRVTFRARGGGIRSGLIDFRRPLAVIPSLAIHLDKTANEERCVNAQTDMQPVLALGDQEERSFNDMLLEQLHEQHAGIDIEKILDFELSLYDSQKPVVTGIDGQFLSGARLDNLVSCFIGLRAMLDTDHSKPSLLVCYDHEEIGSGSFHGAQGPFLRSVLERLLSSAEEFTRMIDRSVMISCDNAHGVHPNYAQKHDDNHRPLLNHGPVLKFNANQRYSTNSETAALFRQLCENVDVPLQEFVMRADMACGSTIGPITATGIGVKTVDVGVPQWAMHSIRETCGAKDPYYMYQVLKEFYVNDL